MNNKRISLIPGLYELLINKNVSSRLKTIARELQFTRQVQEKDADKVYTQYIAEVIHQELTQKANQEDKIKFINDLIATVKKSAWETKTDPLDYDGLELPEIEIPDSQKNSGTGSRELLEILDNKDPNNSLSTKKNEQPVRPQTSMSRSSLLTGSPGEPQMLTELKKEINSASSICFLVSFIRWTGIRNIFDELKSYTSNGGKLRIITTSYMGATEPAAVQRLSELPNTEIKITYETKSTRLHAKAYLFKRETGFTTAYVGSSNLSLVAISSGLEWNMKVTQRDQKDIVEKICATFESYWNDDEFETYTADQKEKLLEAINREKHQSSRQPIQQRYLFDIHPFSYQKKILDELEAERGIRGHYRNLVVAATGTGKTIIAALDYRRFRQNNQRSRLLFVAHRVEILNQSMDAFRTVLKDPNFGEVVAGSNVPSNFDHVFISIQMINSLKLWDKMASDYYDFIVVDEFHHAAANSYQKMLSHFTEAKILLGLTATPERMDGFDITQYFGGRIAAEIRLPEAIERELLCPFHYFGVTDNINLKDLQWSKGGYEVSQLDNLYVFQREMARKRADLIVKSLYYYVSDINNMKGIGFCVSINHAEFMTEQFNLLGINASCLTSQSSPEDRKTAGNKLQKGEIKVIFTVDLLNEGYDLPCINTVLFLRPTQSLTVFLQQLGRGLRLDEGKECLTVLDFIGQAHQKYNFENKFRALLSPSRNSIKEEINQGFVSVPRGCSIKLEKFATSYILENIRNHLLNNQAIISCIRDYYESLTDKSNITLKAFLNFSGLKISEIYKRDNTFSRLKVNAGVIQDFHEPLEKNLAKAFCKFASIDSRSWIMFLQDLLTNLSEVISGPLTRLQQRMLQMFYITIWNDAIDFSNPQPAIDNLKRLAASPVLLQELQEILDCCYDRIDFLDEEIDLGFDCPLALHCSYTLNQILMAVDYMKYKSMRQGVVYSEEHNLDIFLITLNKSENDYSATTMYQDYSINERLFHWQSQSTTSDTCNTALRYIGTKAGDPHKVCLFVREFKKGEPGGTSPYVFLGTATYVQHEGSKPVNFIWRLDKPIPGKFITTTSKIVANY